VSLAPRILAPKGSRILPDALLAPLPEVTLGLYARDGVGASAHEPLLAHMIDLLHTSPALAAA
jgi:hypothetical protein